MLVPDTVAFARCPDTQPCDACTLAASGTGPVGLVGLVGSVGLLLSSPASAGATGSAIAPSSAGRSSRELRGIGNLIISGSLGPTEAGGYPVWRNKGSHSLDSQDVSMGPRTV